MDTIKVFQCKVCGRQSLIAHGYCLACRSKDSLEPTQVNGKGTIFSFTTIYVAEERFQEETPYVVAIVDCENGLRLMARIKKPDSERLSIGAVVEMDEWKEDVPIFRVS